ncbi:STAS domain-containing protein [Roseofilum casamattae]|uniref:Anti-sigma factor antagonist n=1 Tax=Roseofilum casamattae BLCC-M143 TaxID=3022442 RepID=A0ABT7BUY1_9CYAN|nr:STAS domain-containing protein [Roseofilum casamattae]MDJ1182998.1 STAS domain-containing protein [Roseofilum casamattae BLCC-M143]
MDININVEDKVTIVTITGDIDGNTAPQMQEQILPEIGSRAKVLLDMTEVAYLSSAGLRSLLVLSRKASEYTINEQEVQLILVGLSEEIRDTMEITGFLNLFSICSTREEALNH